MICRELHFEGELENALLVGHCDHLARDVQQLRHSLPHRFPGKTHS